MNDYGVSPRREAFDRAAQGVVLGSLSWCAEHWLLVLNLGAFVMFFFPVLGAPAFAAVGWTGAADLIYLATSALCHQLPERSFYLFGEQMAFCHRMSAMHGFLFLFGMLYIPIRRRLKSLPAWLTVVYCLPLVVDGTTQLFGWRESTWELRVATGAFFSLATVWYVYPHFALVMPLARHHLRPTAG